MYSSARRIASGTGGGVGMWEPCGWKAMGYSAGCADQGHVLHSPAAGTRSRLPRTAAAPGSRPGQSIAPVPGPPAPRSPVQAQLTMQCSTTILDLNFLQLCMLIYFVDVASCIQCCYMIT